MLIEMKYDDAFDCLDNVLVNAIKWFGCEYELMYANSWSFGYKKIKDVNKDIISNDFLTKRIYRWDYLKKYHGISVDFFDVDNYVKTINKIKDELENNRPVIIEADTFFCSWYKNEYKRISSQHYCLVVGIDKNNNFLVKDTLLAIEGKVLSEIDFISGVKKYGTFQIMENKQKVEDHKRIIKEALLKLRNEEIGINVFKEMEDFALDISENLIFDNEIIGFEDRPYQSRLFQTIYNVGRGRKQFAIALNFLFEETDIFILEEVSQRMRKVGEYWTSIFGMLCKAHYLSTSRSKILMLKISEKIRNVIIEEQKLADKLLFYVVNGEYKSNAQDKFIGNIIKDLDTYKNYSYLDLSEYYNSKGISYELSLSTSAEITSDRRYILGNDLMKNKKWIIGNLRFVFPEINESLYDNISCFEETIEVPLCYSSNIFILGCAELGNHIENIEVIYSDGESEKVELEFSSWVSRPNFNEIIAWEGKGVERDKDEASTYPFQVYLFAQNIKLSREGTITKLIMPNCPNIHIFAITLAS